MSDDSEQPPYKVGYAKPPEHSRFKPGQSGNPRGRTRASKNSATVVRDALNARVKLKDSKRTMSKLEIGITRLANKAADGDLRAIGMVIDLYRQVEAEATGHSREEPLDHADREILDMLLKKVRAASGENKDGK